MDDDGKIFTTLQTQPTLAVVTIPAPCSTRANDADRTPCLGKAVLRLDWYEYDREECSCCPYYDNGYVSFTRWACPDCIPAMLAWLKNYLVDYKMTIDEEFDALTTRLLAGSIAVPDGYEIKEWKKKQAEREAEALLTSDQKLRRALHMEDED